MIRFRRPGASQLSTITRVKTRGIILRGMGGPHLGSRHASVFQLSRGGEGRKQRRALVTHEREFICPFQDSFVS
jgi:hypothetical protein